MTVQYFRDLSGSVWGYDATQTALIAAVPATWTNITGSWPPATPAPTLAQLAAAALASGLTITSPTIPLAAVAFDCGAAAQDHINAEITSILLNATFADGAASVVWPDLAGVSHTMTVAQFKAFASAQGAYVAALYKCLNGVLTALPAASVTIQ